MYVEDRPLAEVAELLGVAEGTVKSRAHRVRRLLRAALRLNDPGPRGGSVAEGRLLMAEFDAGWTDGPAVDAGIACGPADVDLGRVWVGVAREVGRRPRWRRTRDTTRFVVSSKCAAAWRRGRPDPDGDELIRHPTHGDTLHERVHARGDALCLNSLESPCN